MRIHALILALALAACGPAQQAPETPQGPDALDPEIMSQQIAQSHAQLDQVAALSGERPGASDIADADPRALARRLREAVWRYNLQRSELCGRGLFRDIACGPAYEPVWINEPMDAAPSLEVLAERKAGVDALVTPFWGAVCADARARNVQIEAGACGAD